MRGGRLKFLYKPFENNVSKRLSTSQLKFDHLEYSRNANGIIKKLSQLDRRKQELFDRNSTYSSLTKFQRIPEKPSSTVYVADDVADERDCSMLCKMLEDSDFQSFMVTPGERKVPADTSLLEDIFYNNDRAISILDYLKRVMQAKVETAYNQSVYEAGSIISWLSPPYAINFDHETTGFHLPQTALPVDIIAPEEGTYSYWSAHCDKANNNDYDVSCLLYLNSDFAGGDLIMMDEGVDWHIEPKRGRLLIFNSCVNNIHRVQAVTKGNRFLLSVWYSLKHYRT
jgi:hypothetical protein